MYPAVVMQSKDHRTVLLGADTKCPALSRSEVSAKLKNYLNWIQRYLESADLSSLIRQNPQFISVYQEEVVEVRELSLGKA